MMFVCCGPVFFFLGGTGEFGYISGDVFVCCKAVGVSDMVLKTSWFIIKKNYASLKVKQETLHDLKVVMSCSCKWEGVDHWITRTLDWQWHCFGVTGNRCTFFKAVLTPRVICWAWSVLNMHTFCILLLMYLLCHPPTHPTHTPWSFQWKKLREVRSAWKFCWKWERIGLLISGLPPPSPPPPPQPHQKLQNLMHLSGLGDYSGCEASQPCGPLPHQILGHEICHSSCLHCAQGGSGKHALTGPHFSCTAAPFPCSNTAELLFPL